MVVAFVFFIHFLPSAGRHNFVFENIFFLDVYNFAKCVPMTTTKECCIHFYGPVVNERTYVKQLTVPHGTSLGVVRSHVSRRFGIPLNSLFLFEMKSGDLVTNKIKRDCFIAKFSKKQDRYYESRVELGAQLDSFRPIRTQCASKPSKPTKKAVVFSFVD